MCRLWLQLGNLLVVICLGVGGRIQTLTYNVNSPASGHPRKAFLNTEAYKHIRTPTYKKTLPGFMADPRNTTIQKHKQNYKSELLMFSTSCTLPSTPAGNICPASLLASRCGMPSRYWPRLHLMETLGAWLWAWVSEARYRFMPCTQQQHQVDWLWFIRG